MKYSDIEDAFIFVSQDPYSDRTAFINRESEDICYHSEVAETRDFFVTHFGARVTFDCGWYVNLECGAPAVTLQFMSPREAHHRPSASDGLIYNFCIDDVDTEYTRLTAAGLLPVMPLEDHPWGDRGFAVTDPNGISRCIYSERVPTAEYQQYFNR